MIDVGVGIIDSVSVASDGYIESIPDLLHMLSTW